MTGHFHAKQNPGGCSAGVSESIIPVGIDGFEHTPGGSSNQAIRHISRRGRVSRPYASVLWEMMRTRS